MEAATGFEPVIRALQARALPLGYAASGLCLYGTTGPASSGQESFREIQPARAGAEPDWVRFEVELV